MYISLLLKVATLRSQRVITATLDAMQCTSTCSQLVINNRLYPEAMFWYYGPIICLHRHSCTLSIFAGDFCDVSSLCAEPKDFAISEFLMFLNLKFMQGIIIIGQKLIFFFHGLKSLSVASLPVQICHMTSSLRSQHFRGERETIVSWAA